MNIFMYLLSFLAIGWISNIAILAYLIKQGKETLRSIALLSMVCPIPYLMTIGVVLVVMDKKR